MTLINPEIDAYGTYERASALADIAELLRIRGHHVTEASVVDYMQEMNWLDKKLELLTVVGEDEVIQPDIFDLLRERQHALGEAYPFSVDAGVLALTDLPAVGYRLLHSITLAHSYQLMAPNHVEAVFEESVCRIFRRRGFKTANLSLLRHNEGSFTAALVAARPLTDLSIPIEGEFSAYAQDEGVDLIGHLDWLDRRELNWVFIGQATCAKSDEWERKILEPSPQAFKGFLGSLIPPIAFLTIPHHSHTRRLQHIGQRTERLILDRLRLAPWVEELSADETEIVDHVEMAEVPPPY